MAENTTSPRNRFQVSDMAEHLIGSEIIKLATEINEKIKSGKKIYNFTIGDFDPKIFPIPAELQEAIFSAYQQHSTNYPMWNGMPELRKAISAFLNDYQGIQYSPDEILVAGGARPIIYSAYRTLLDPGDKVVFPVPSWNNNHYCHLTGARQVFVETKPENNFMPTADELRPHLQDAQLLALCSPLNPTGTVFSQKQLEDICDLVIETNRQRSPDKKPLYLLFDQIYWVLTYGDTRHYDPVSLRPELRDYTVFTDGISKSLAATGVRVGWGFGPHAIIDKMKAINSHVGSWAPKPEQIATAHYLDRRDQVDSFLHSFKHEVEERLQRIYQGIIALKDQGHRVNAIAPQAAIYLTVQFDLTGKTTPSGKVLESQHDVLEFILNEANLALVPFAFFGSSKDSPWYRLSVGTCDKTKIDEMLASLSKALNSLR